MGGGIGRQVGAILLATHALTGGTDTPAERAFVVAFGVMIALSLIGAVCGALVPSEKS